jgi:hypothetical protein
MLPVPTVQVRRLGPTDVSTADACSLRRLMSRKKSTAPIRLAGVKERGIVTCPDAWVGAASGHPDAPEGQGRRAPTLVDGHNDPNIAKPLLICVPAGGVPGPCRPV